MRGSSLEPAAKASAASHKRNPRFPPVDCGSRSPLLGSGDQDRAASAVRDPFAEDQARLIALRSGTRMICHTQNSAPGTPSAKPTSSLRASTQKLMSGGHDVPAASSPADRLQTLGAPGGRLAGSRRTFSTDA